MPEVTRDELVDELHRLKEELSEKPSATDMNRLGEYSTGPYQRHFGSWNDALREAGFEPNQSSKKIPTDDLLNEIRRLARKLNRTPTRDQMDEIGEYYGKSYRLRFGSWSKAVRQAGLKPNQRIPKSEFRKRPDMCPLCGMSSDELDFHHWRYGENKSGCYFCRDCHDRIHAGGARPEEDSDWLLKAIENLIRSNVEHQDHTNVSTIVERYNIPSEGLVECVITDLNV